MFDEQEHYRQHLLSLPPEKILDSAYEYTIREDILLSLEYNDLTTRQCQALLKSEHPLQDVFRAGSITKVPIWRKCRPLSKQRRMICAICMPKRHTERSDSPWHTSPRRIFSRQNSWIC